jgi:chorismate-pyruvate lyase
MLNLDWQKSYSNIPKNVENWLFDGGSLTAKLKIFIQILMLRL